MYFVSLLCSSSSLHYQHHVLHEMLKHVALQQNLILTIQLQLQKLLLVGDSEQYLLQRQISAAKVPCHQKYVNFPSH